MRSIPNGIISSYHDRNSSSYFCGCPNRALSKSVRRMSGQSFSWGPVLYPVFETLQAPLNQALRNVDHTLVGMADITAKAAAKRPFDEY
jgi:hypothetical protein